MEERIFLTEEQIVALNVRAVRQGGGIHGVRDHGLLSAAVAMPRASFGGRYLHESIPAMAAAYLFHICQAQAFQDGNKRTAVLAAVVFLDLNGYELRVEDDRFEQIVLAAASQGAGKEQVTAFFAEHAVRRRR